MSTAAPRRAPRIVFNSDGDIHFRGVQSPQDMDGFYRGIDELAGTQVDCYCYCISAGGDTYRHPSDVAPLLGADLETLDGVPDYLRRDIENTRALLAAGIDPLVLLPRRARQHGMKFWASMRMNDIHDDYPECAAYHGGFRKAHPELLLGSPYPEPKHRGNWRAGFCWGLDYARPEVRARQLALIEEVLTRYDVDGFELDFLRGAYYFKTNERRTGMPLMTGFVRDVRALVDRAGEGKGRPLTLAIRVGRDVAECETSGLDVRTWAAEGLADLLIPMWAGRMDTEADVAGMVALARTADSSGTRVAGGLVGSVYGYGILPDHDTGLWCNATLEMMRAGAMTYFSQGAACTYLFNYDCQRLHGVNKPYSHDELQALREVGDAAVLAHLNKRYVVSWTAPWASRRETWMGRSRGPRGGGCNSPRSCTAWATRACFVSGSATTWRRRGGTTRWTRCASASRPTAIAPRTTRSSWRSTAHRWRVTRTSGARTDCSTRSTPAGACEGFPSATNARTTPTSWRGRRRSRTCCAKAGTS